ncbi:MAG: serine O-acetyltransferase, partial [Noviherbaspirillum sp.]
MNRTEYQVTPRTSMPRPRLVLSSLARKSDDVWQQIRDAAAEVARREPLLQPRMCSLVLDHATPGAMVAAVLARRLACADLKEAGLRALIEDVFADSAIVAQVAADLAAVRERDPACPDTLHVLL